MIKAHLSLAVVLTLFLLSSCKKTDEEIPQSRSIIYPSDKGTCIVVLSDTLYLRGTRNTLIKDSLAVSLEEFKRGASPILDSTLLHLNSEYFDPDPPNGFVHIKETAPTYTGDTVYLSIEKDLPFSSYIRLLSICGKYGFNHIVLSVDNREFISFSLSADEKTESENSVTTSLLFCDSALIIAIKNDFLPSIRYISSEEGKTVNEYGIRFYAWYEKGTDAFLTDDTCGIFEMDLEKDKYYWLFPGESSLKSTPPQKIIPENMGRFERRLLKAEDLMQTYLLTSLEKYPNANDKESVIIAAENSVNFGDVRSFIQRLKFLGIDDFSFALLPR